VTTIYEVLDRLRSLAIDEHDKGKRFEHLIKTWLLEDPQMSSIFESVVSWNQWPDRPSDQDVGIDLVGTERETGKLWGIQCKFYEEDKYISKEAIGTFFSELGKDAFSKGLFVTTSNNWSKHAEETFDGQTKEVLRIGMSQLQESPFDWSKVSLDHLDELTRLPKHTLRPHQREAVDDAIKGFEVNDRGQLIMACGTGKTFTSLKVAEELLPNGGTVLFLVPSIALLSQTLSEWTNECELPLKSFAVCSDSKVGKNIKDEDIRSFDLAYPATTNVSRLIENYQLHTKGFEGLRVIFSTYQSIEVVSDAQKVGLPEFDLIICDEAHRTTGVTLSDEDDSPFVRVHDQSFIQAKRRLYMTATPRVYADQVKVKADQLDAVLASMDNKKLYGPEFHRLMFGQAVERKLLSDYRVVILTVSEQKVAELMAIGQGDALDLRLDEVARIIGCYNGLAKRSSTADEFSSDPAPMKRAVAFSSSIAASKTFSNKAAEVINTLLLNEDDDESIRIRTEHVDGTNNILIRNRRLQWLKDEPEPGTVKVLTNARCLSEGVDVPALDAVLFLSPRNSVVDVVQSVGRVMRKSEGKEYGYVIVPVAIGSFESPEEALNDNKRFKTVWQVLQALRSHDERFAAMVNRIALDGKGPGNVIFAPGFGSDDENKAMEDKQMELPLFELEGWKEAVLAKLVSKVGQREYWENWAKNIAEISATFQLRVQSIIDAADEDLREKFQRFLEGLRTNINPNVTESESIEMLSQHLVTKPVFDALFENYEFSSHNPVSIVMEEMLTALNAHSLERESSDLTKFYESVRERVAGIETAEGKQQVIKELYDNFFRGAFKTTADSLGIVYTPIEVIDYMIHAVNGVLRETFDVSIGQPGVQILDPFTGTGSFITRLLQSGLIGPDELEHKYRHELHANEIVLLAYYIAAVNIEEAFHGLHSGGYQSFDGIVLTDTFQMNEGDQSGKFRDTNVFHANSARVMAQKNADIRVIISNPPYSVGQEVEGDGDAREDYPDLDQRLRETYVAKSAATQSKSLFDSYIRAFRWASDRVSDKGIVCFVSGGGWLDSAAASGMRRSLVDEFSKIYVLNLRGNQRTTQGEKSRSEGGKIFGQGSRTAVTITLLVKDSTSKGKGKILYHDIGDYLTREDKLNMLVNASHGEGFKWQTIAPNEQADWINQRHSGFEKFVPLGDPDAKGKEREAIFTNVSLGLSTNRDSWAYSFSKTSLTHQMVDLIERYNNVVKADIDGDEKRAIELEKLVKWDSSLTASRKARKLGEFRSDALVRSMYRPFAMQWCYFDKMFNARVSQLPSFVTEENPNPPMIVATGVGSSAGFSVFMTKDLPNLHLLHSSQDFPLFWYEAPSNEGGLLSTNEPLTRRDGISKWALSKFRTLYGSGTTSEDIFHYVYGLLHSPTFVAMYEDNLVKERPRIPIVDSEDLYLAFRDAGRELAELHLNYETVQPYELDEVTCGKAVAASKLYNVEKMRFPSGVKLIDRPSSIVVNQYLRLDGIPEECWDYMLSGKAALYWIMDRYQIKKDTESGIVNNPNDYSDDPRYIVELIKRVVTVSLETLRIVNSLPDSVVGKSSAS
jgi:predicted helicase